MLLPCLPAGLDQGDELLRLRGLAIGEFEELRVAHGYVQHPEGQVARVFLSRPSHSAGDERVQVRQLAGEQQSLIGGKHVHGFSTQVRQSPRLCGKAPGGERRRRPRPVWVVLAAASSPPHLLVAPPAGVSEQVLGVVDDDQQAVPLH